MRTRTHWRGGAYGVCSVAAVFFILGAFGGQARTEGMTDREIVVAVQDQLMPNTGVSPHALHVEAKDGVVILTGSVENISAQERAVRLTKTVKGVRSVVNHIHVDPAIRPDGEIREDVETVLATHPAMDMKQMRVEVEGGVVTLRGKADTLLAGRPGREAAKGVRGVRDVRDRIDYRVRENMPDDKLEQGIWAHLVWDPWVDESLIQVRVKDGHVSLEGFVGSGRERWRAYQDAWIPGVRSVDHRELKVHSRMQEELRQGRMYVQKGDQEIEEALNTALSLDSRLSDYRIEAESDFGIVSLTGTVESREDRNRASELAMNTVGVWRVKNHLVLRSAMAPMGPLPRPYSMLYSFDPDLAQKVQVALLQDPDVEQHEISVSVDTGRIAHLSGIVDSEFERIRAGEVASGVKGVREVVNDIRVRVAWVERNDGEIKRAIERELWWSPFVDSGDIRVFVNDGVVTLAGLVDDLEERRAATKNAYDGGAKRVRNYVKVRNGPDYYRPIDMGSL